MRQEWCELCSHNRIGKYLDWADSTVMLFRWLTASIRNRFVSAGTFLSGSSVFPLGGCRLPDESSQDFMCTTIQYLGREV